LDKQEMNKNLLLFLIAIILICLSACSANTRTWQEEVKLLDGRIIVISVKYRKEGAYNGSSYGGVLRESWVTLKLPETGNNETTWNERLWPLNLNVVGGKLYIVGIPPTTDEFEFYHKPRPPYVGYVFENKAWRQIPFSQIPESMYDVNVSSNTKKLKSDKPITLAEKAIELGNPTRFKPLQRIDPTYRYVNDNGSN
jgi:hypothetical protein